MVLQVIFQFIVEINFPSKGLNGIPNRVSLCLGHKLSLQGISWGFGGSGARTCQADVGGV